MYVYICCVPAFIPMRFGVHARGHCISVGARVGPVYL